MAKWLRTLDVSDVWDKVPDEITIQQLAKIVAERLGKLLPIPFATNINDYGLQLVQDFNDLSEDEEADSDTFDEIWHTLYNWADQKCIGGKVCWVKTF